MTIMNIPFLEHCNELTQSISLNRQCLIHCAEFLALELQFMVTCPANYSMLGQQCIPVTHLIHQPSFAFVHPKTSVNFHLFINTGLKDTPLRTTATLVILHQTINFSYVFITHLC